VTGVKGLIFDCDGVLMDSRESNITYYNLLRSRLGLPLMSKADEDFVHMATFEKSLERAIPAALLPQLRHAAANISYTRDIMPLLAPAAGLRSCLDSLVSKGIELGICTNRSGSMFTILERFSMDKYFSQVITVLQAPPKPSPDGLLAILKAWNAHSSDVVFIGDSSLDQQAAANAGMRFWAFANPQIRAERHISCFDDLSQLFRECPA